MLGHQKNQLSDKAANGIRSSLIIFSDSYPDFELNPAKSGVL
ncbi:hypothetical protein D1AOALGA4SA_2456 [Olavius algarvensis Delta 1 endosymbiont]|nr:hypothetical protein D1AOALGA4SA_2456 [Olavius algarvensis Delta 1 endosymbiont]